VLYKDGKLIRKRQEYFASNSKRISFPINRDTRPGPGSYDLKSKENNESKI